ncbi:MAG TPA: 2'-deoxycytidine 5'-triphosphate deaminase [Terriglobales bacterium]|jgi:dCTP deaminase|nr:2'-deoxycytidine 5'-triphosphate deaminase [Terriglobales bacterium]
MNTSKQNLPDAPELERNNGILPAQSLRALVKNGVIAAPESLPIKDEQIQPASIDLRLGQQAFHVRASFLPGKSSTLLKKVHDGLLIDTLDLRQPTLLTPNSVYIVKLTETLSLPADVSGIANPKSTTGRLDIFTRLITEHGEEFERVPRGYSGELYAEVVTRSFPVYVREGLKLNQLRFIRGKVEARRDSVLRELAKDDQLVRYETEDRLVDAINRGLSVTVNLEGSERSDIVAYKAKKYAAPIDLSKIRHYEMADFWEFIRKPATRRLILEPDEFYLLASKEKVRVPPDHAAEMVAYDPTMGEFHVHYAGFFDPGFGYGAQGEIPGTKAVLEVRAHDMPILLEDGQFVGKLLYYRMAAIPEVVYGQDIGSSYQKQELTPSKQFKFTEPQESAPVKQEERQAEWGGRGRRDVVLLEQH